MTARMSEFVSEMPHDLRHCLCVRPTISRGKRVRWLFAFAKHCSAVLPDSLAAWEPFVAQKPSAYPLIKQSLQAGMIVPPLLKPEP